MDNATAERLAETWRAHTQQGYVYIGKARRAWTCELRCAALPSQPQPRCCR